MNFPIILANNNWMDTIVVASTANVYVQVSNIPMLNGTNFKVWKDTSKLSLVVWIWSLLFGRTNSLLLKEMLIRLK